jgi:hypothetical protein
MWISVYQILYSWLQRLAAAIKTAEEKLRTTAITLLYILTEKEISTRVHFFSKL